MKMNLPNKLTVLRLSLVPVIILVGMLPIDFFLSCFICAVLFIITSITDMLDGKIARKYNLVTHDIKNKKHLTPKGKKQFAFHKKERFCLL